jgi:branched-chain amino acid transport system permease protein
MTAHAGVLHEPALDWRNIVRVGGAGALVAIYLCLVGVVPIGGERPVVAGIISLGEAAIISSLALTGAIAARRTVGVRNVLVTGGASGLLAGLALTLLVVISSSFNMRGLVLNASPALVDLLTFENGVQGAWIPAVIGLGLGLLGGAFWITPGRIRSPIVRGLLAIFILGMFAGLLRTPLISAGLNQFARTIFATEGLTPFGAAAAFAIVAGARVLRQRVNVVARVDSLPPAQLQWLKIGVMIVAAALVLVAPLVLGNFVAQVTATVALYILMGFGLNITLGLAGLLDLGFVAFYAVGAYTVGLLTSTAEFGLLDWPFWAAVPVGVAMAMLFGAVLGLPILGIRGDYLAIATLGFGEIIRILVGSDLLKSVLGGPRGVINIPKPIEVPASHFLAGPVQIYYIAIGFAVLVAFLALRLRASRLGRAWVAIREDEDVAEASGINLIQTKILAYVLGAAFAGLGGAIFGAQNGAIFPSSIQLLISINVAALIIVGGMGSIPGVVVGALFLVGIPELFREFEDYRLLLYGVALIAVMRFRPEGLLPSRIVKRELHVPENEGPAPALAVDGTP